MTRYSVLSTNPDDYINISTKIVVRRTIIDDSEVGVRIVAIESCDAHDLIDVYTDKNTVDWMANCPHMPTVSS